MREVALVQILLPMLLATWLAFGRAPSRGDLALRLAAAWLLLAGLWLVPVRDRQHLEGNFVRIRCGGMVVFLGHFRQDGVEVRAGDRVSAGQRLGTVGNSGNSDEPHLHIHVQGQGPAEAPLSANRSSPPSAGGFSCGTWSSPRRQRGASGCAGKKGEIWPCTLVRSC